MEEKQTSSIPRPSNSNRIHILGLGNIGKLFAHSLANLEDPPSITLLFHRSSLLSEWEKAGQKITITTNGTANSGGHYDVEIITPMDNTAVSNLIVATKTINTISALSSISQRLNADSTVLFTQNGMGMLEEASAQVFQNISERPSFLTSITSHGIYALDTFSSVHAGQAFISIGRATQDLSHGNPSQSQHLIDQFLRSPVLAAKQYPPQELLFLQLEKLVINAMINPLTVIFDCKNGELFSREPVLRLMRLLLGEVSRVLLALPEIRGAEGLGRRFEVVELERKVLDVAAKTAANISSMRQDVLAGRETEIEYINGWVIKKGRELGVECEQNERLVEMVKEGKRLAIAEVEGYLAR